MLFVGVAVVSSRFRVIGKVHPGNFPEGRIDF